MSIRVQLVCDVCGGDFGSDADGKSASRSLRDDAHLTGWQSIEVGKAKNDVCPKCLRVHGWTGVRRILKDELAAATKGA